MTASPDPPAIASSDYRDLMRELAAGVTIVTTGERGARRGLTATAVCSLSDAPPILLACINRRASAHDLIVQQRAFAVNVLAADQIAIAQCFSGQTGLAGEDRFSQGKWETMVTGAPVLVGALVNIDCELVEEKSVATHTIFLGRVVAGRGSSSAAALIYRSGTYGLLEYSCPPSELRPKSITERMEK